MASTVEAFADPTSGPSSAQATVPTGKALVKQRIGIWWQGDGRYYYGRVRSYNSKSNSYRVGYDDGQVDRALVFLQMKMGEETTAQPCVMVDKYKDLDDSSDDEAEDKADGDEELQQSVQPIGRPRPNHKRAHELAAAARQGDGNDSEDTDQLALAQHVQRSSRQADSAHVPLSGGSSQQQPTSGVGPSTGRGGRGRGRTRSTKKTKAEATAGSDSGEAAPLASLSIKAATTSKRPAVAHTTSPSTTKGKAPRRTTRQRSKEATSQQEPAATPVSPVGADKAAADKVGADKDKAGAGMVRNAARERAQEEDDDDEAPLALVAGSSVTAATPAAPLVPSAASPPKRGRGAGKRKRTDEQDATGAEQQATETPEAVEQPSKEEDTGSAEANNTTRRSSRARRPTVRPPRYHDAVTDEDFQVDDLINQLEQSEPTENKPAAPLPSSGRGRGRGRNTATATLKPTLATTGRQLRSRSRSKDTVAASTEVAAEAQAGAASAAVIQQEPGGEGQGEKGTGVAAAIGVRFRGRPRKAKLEAMESRSLPEAVETGGAKVQEAVKGKKGEPAQESGAAEAGGSKRVTRRRAAASRRGVGKANDVEVANTNEGQVAAVPTKEAKPAAAAEEWEGKGAAGVAGEHQDSAGTAAADGAHSIGGNTQEQAPNASTQPIPSASPPAPPPGSEAQHTLASKGSAVAKPPKPRSKDQKTSKDTTSPSALNPQLETLTAPEAAAVTPEKLGVATQEKVAGKMGCTRERACGDGGDRGVAGEREAAAEVESGEEEKVNEAWKGTLQHWTSGREEGAEQQKTLSTVWPSNMVLATPAPSLTTPGPSPTQAPRPARPTPSIRGAPAASSGIADQASSAPGGGTPAAAAAATTSLQPATKFTAAATPVQSSSKAGAAAPSPTAAASAQLASKATDAAGIGSAMSLPPSTKAAFPAAFNISQAGSKGIAPQPTPAPSPVSKPPSAMSQPTSPLPTLGIKPSATSTIITPETLNSLLREAGQITVEPPRPMVKSTSTVIGSNTRVTKVTKVVSSVTRRATVVRRSSPPAMVTGMSQPVAGTEPGRASGSASRQEQQVRAEGGDDRRGEGGEIRHGEEGPPVRSGANSALGAGPGSGSQRAVRSTAPVAADEGHAQDRARAQPCDSLSQRAGVKPTGGVNGAGQHKGSRAPDGGDASKPGDVRQPHKVVDASGSSRSGELGNAGEDRKRRREERDNGMCSGRGNDTAGPRGADAAGERRGELRAAGVSLAAGAPSTRPSWFELHGTMEWEWDCSMLQPEPREGESALDDEGARQLKTELKQRLSWWPHHTFLPKPPLLLSQPVAGPSLSRGSSADL